MFHLLKIRTGIDILKNEKCKVTFGLEYRFKSHIRQVFSTENHCCLSLSKCVNDKIEYKHHRLQRK